MAGFWTETIKSIEAMNERWVHNDQCVNEMKQNLSASVWSGAAKSRFENWDVVDKSQEFVSDSPNEKLDSLLENPPALWEYVDYWLITFNEIAVMSSTNDLSLIMDFEKDWNVSSTEGQSANGTVLEVWTYRLRCYSQIADEQSRVRCETDSWGEEYNKVFTSETALSVEFSSVPKAEVVWKSIDISWSTSNESDNDMFQLERVNPSTNDFDIIGYVEPDSPDSDTTRDYTFLDVQPIDWHNLYRVVQTDYDGTRTISPTFSAEYINPDELDISQVTDSPNPLAWNDLVLDIDYLNSQWVDSRNVNLVSMRGDYVPPSIDDSMNKSYNLANYPKGIYVLVVMTKNGVYTKKVTN